MKKLVLLMVLVFSIGLLGADDKNAKAKKCPGKCKTPCGTVVPDKAGSDVKETEVIETKTSCPKMAHGGKCDDMEKCQHDHGTPCNGDQKCDHKSKWWKFWDKEKDCCGKTDKG